VVAGDGEVRVHSIADAALQIAGSHQAVMLGVPHDRLDGIAAFERATPRSGHAPLLSHDVHTTDSVSAITTIEITAFCFSGAVEKSDTKCSRTP